MKVNFVKVLIPCVTDGEVLWHLEHGCCYDVVEVGSGRRLGVFFATLLCGDGCIIHFSVSPECSSPGSISPATILYAFRKGIRTASMLGEVIYATIPEEKKGLIRVVELLSFRILPEGSFFRDGKKILLLKYFPHKRGILPGKDPQRKEQL